MPDRPLDPRPPSVATAHTHRSQADQARRSALLEAATLRWLRHAGWPEASASAQVRSVEPAVSDWLHDTPAAQLFDRLPSLAEDLGRQLPATHPLTPAGFLGAFAHGLVALALDEVAREAQRAGHANVFAGLRPFLHDEPTPAQLADLGVALQLSQAALAIALARLRKRWRERIEAALGLWATSPETRHTLRRQLRQSLIGSESSP